MARDSYGKSFINESNTNEIFTPPNYRRLTVILCISGFQVDLHCLEKDTYSMLETPKDVNSIPSDAEATASGLASRVLTAGTGTESPAATDTVSVHYSGWTTDGNLFDSSVERGEPTSFPLNRVIKGWTEGLQLMVVGEKRRFWIPADLAYGENPGGGRPGGLLVFDVELLGIEKAPEPPMVPEDVAAIPASAKVHESGLASRKLSVGTGSTHPTKADIVTVHYSGWTTDGEMFDSSVMRGTRHF